MQYVIWTQTEEHALCQALAHAWLRYGVTEVHQDHFRTLIRLAAHDGGDWRTRTLSSRAARVFIEKHHAVLEGLMKPNTEPEYTVEGYEHPMTVKQMQDEIVRLNAEVQRLTPPPAPPQPVAPIATRPPKPDAECDGVYRSQVLTQKTRVAIAGVHDKHRDNIIRAFPHLIITWIEPRDNDAVIKSKASGRPSIACTHGTNSKVLRLLHNICPKFFTVGGAHGVRDTLANANFA